jgi:hypothetical protein
MKTKMQVIAMMYRYDMRHNEGPYSFGFHEGKYFFSYHNHSTGRDLRISIVADDGDSMQVYDQTEWYYSRYYFNGFGKGYTPGPWVKEIEDMFKKFRSELAAKIQFTRKAKKIFKREDELRERDRINKFSRMCEDIVA